MEPERLKSILESLIFVSDEPVPLQRLAQLVGMKDKKALKTALDEVKQSFIDSKGGIELVEVAGGYQFRTSSDNSEWVGKLFEERPQKLTRPSLETMAIVSYRQPITRLDVERIRGVDSGGVLKTLLERNLVRIVGRQDAPGRPVLYGTTTEFLEFFGLNDLNDLPPLRDIAELGDAAEEMIAEYVKREDAAEAGIPFDPAVPGEEGAAEAAPPAEGGSEPSTEAGESEAPAGENDANEEAGSEDKNLDDGANGSLGDDPPPDPLDEDYGSNPDADTDDGDGEEKPE